MNELDIIKEIEKYDFDSALYENIMNDWLALHWQDYWIEDPLEWYSQYWDIASQINIIIMDFIWNNINLDPFSKLENWETVYDFIKNNTDINLNNIL